MMNASMKSAQLAFCAALALAAAGCLTDEKRVDIGTQVPGEKCSAHANWSRAAWA